MEKIDRHAEICTIIQREMARGMERWTRNMIAMVRPEYRLKHQERWVADAQALAREIINAMQIQVIDNGQAMARRKGINVVQAAIYQMGGVETVVAKLGVSKRAVYGWMASGHMRGVAAEVVIKLARLSGIKADSLVGFAPVTLPDWSRKGGGFGREKLRDRNRGEQGTERERESKASARTSRTSSLDDDPGIPAAGENQGSTHSNEHDHRRTDTRKSGEKDRQRGARLSD